MEITPRYPGDALHPAACPATLPDMHFVYVKVPQRRHATPDLEDLHNALQLALDQAQAGGILGWGTSLPAAEAAAGAPGSFHRIDIELQAPEAGLQVLREALSRLGAPAGTELHYTQDGTAWQQSLSVQGWSAPMPGSGTHRPPDR